ncbi:putative transposase, mutator type [Candidatus Erwinia dacicola]|uniref:Transposase, mutator type n=2 Tax=Candidatus Erwinia dacicola TaxID=252393 RepID=A0A328TD55_9GAMM|nr:putative transposase, mutator type [Candidatus Erwinia dacicola]
MIASAVEAELAVMLARFADLRLDDGRQTVVRNDFLPEPRIQTGIGDVSVKVPKLRERNGNGIHFNSTLLPP